MSNRLTPKTPLTSCYPYKLTSGNELCRTHQAPSLVTRKEEPHGQDLDFGEEEVHHKSESKNFRFHLVPIQSGLVYFGLKAKF